MEETVGRVKVSIADPNRRRVSIRADCNAQEEGCECKKDVSEYEGSALVAVKKTATNSKAGGRFLNQIPESILEDESLNEAIKVLPSNYNFEVHKTIWQVRRTGARRVALQLPEGFQRYALVLSDILVNFGGCEETTILADVAYGACCIDDFTANLLGCDLIIHYGHSCLIPITLTKVPVLYIFVEISISVEPLLSVMQANFLGKKIALLATVQYVGVLHVIKNSELCKETDLFIPQIKPLSPGEVLGCTAPTLPVETDLMIFVADGRFHLEAAMIANPKIPAFRYDPFTKTVFEEHYDHSLLLATRRRMIEIGKDAKNFGVILGTLGRQGSPFILFDLVSKLKRFGRTATIFLMSEIRPERLIQFKDIEVWVQTSCPRLSIDWNYTFGDDRPLLTPYELNVLLGQVKPFWDRKVESDNESSLSIITPDGSYPMDFYATGDEAKYSGPWTPGFHLRPPRKKITK